MPVVVVHGVESSVTSWGSPTYTAINDALTTIELTNPTTGEPLGGWVGPRPRVTRSIRELTGHAWITEVAWPYQWPDAAGVDPARVQRQVLDAVQRQLGSESSDWTIRLEPYSETVNGPLSWWQSGAASVTQTQEQPPTGGGRLDAPENPVGPTTAATHPTTAMDWFRGLQGAGKSMLPWVVFGIAGYVAYKTGALQNMRRRPPRREAVANPFLAGRR